MDTSKQINIIKRYKNTDPLYSCNKIVEIKWASFFPQASQANHASSFSRSLSQQPIGDTIFNLYINWTNSIRNQRLSNLVLNEIIVTGGIYDTSITVQQLGMNTLWMCKGEAQSQNYEN